MGLLFASTTAMIGSGWLFGAFFAAKMAGPWSIASWIVGAVIIAMIALCFAELATMFPRSGALVHMSHASHGPGLGRLWGWLLFLAFAPIPAVEAQAIVTYANNYAPFLIEPGSDGLLTLWGYLTSAFALFIMALINLMSVRWMMRLNNIIAWWKVLVPLGTVVALLAVSHHPSNLTVEADSEHFLGIFTALPTAGVIFSFLGFRSAIDLAGESRNPGRDIPMALLGSLTLATLVYITLQVAFLLTVSPDALTQGWASLAFASGQTGPFASLAIGLGLGWVATIIYIDAYASPVGTGLILLASSVRVLHANGSLGDGPRWLTRVSRFGIPWLSVIATWIAGCFFLLPFPAWQQLVGYITSITILTFGIGPVALLCLRRNAPEQPRKFRLRAAQVIAPIAFIACNWVVYWTGYDTNDFLFRLLGGVFIVYAIFYHFVARRPREDFGWRHIAWLLPWFGGMWLISKLGGIHGGLGILSFTSALIVIAIWSLIVMALALASSLNRQETQATIQHILADEQTPTDPTQRDNLGEQSAPRPC